LVYLLDMPNGVRDFILMYLVAVLGFVIGEVILSYLRKPKVKIPPFSG